MAFGVFDLVPFLTQNPEPGTLFCASCDAPCDTPQPTLNTVNEAKHVFLLRLTRNEDGHLRAILRVRGRDRVRYFASIEALARYLQSLEAPIRPKGLR